MSFVCPESLYFSSGVYRTTWQFVHLRYFMDTLSLTLDSIFQERNGSSALSRVPVTAEYILIE